MQSDVEMRSLIQIIMTQTQSQLSQFTQFTVKIENCLLKALSSTQRLLNAQTIQQIQSKIQEISNTDSVVSVIQHFLFTLINQVQDLKQLAHIDIEKQDYQNLQGSVQKAEAQIRKHIRLEQQLKIYMDGLEEKVQQLQREVKVQSQKYMQLFESMKAMDAEKRELKKKIKDLEIKLKPSVEKDLRQLSHKTSKILSEPSINQHEVHGYHIYKLYNDKSRITKSKHFLQKSANQKQIPSEQEKEKKKGGLDEQINVSLAHSPKRVNQLIQRSQIKQMTRTIQLKQSNYRKQSRKLIKYSTDQRIIGSNSTHKRGDARSNSVCH